MEFSQHMKIWLEIDIMDIADTVHMWEQHIEDWFVLP